MKASLLISSGLLLSTYGVFGYSLSSIAPLWSVEAAALGFFLLQLLTLTSFFQNCILILQSWFSKDVINLVMILTAAFFAALSLVWYHIFENLLLVIAAELLARLDFRRTGLTRYQSIAAATLILLIGLAAGWVLHSKLSTPQPN